MHASFGFGYVSPRSDFGSALPRIKLRRSLPCAAHAIDSMLRYLSNPGGPCSVPNARASPLKF
jgi:hypothetical protein